MKNGQRATHMKTARSREAQYAELPATDDNGNPAKPKFRAWLRGKFGATFAQRHEGAKPRDEKVGAPFTRVQHRTGTVARRRT